MMHMKMIESGRDMGFRDMDMDPEEAYELGCKAGYRKGFADAMRESAEMSGYRGGESGMGERYPQYPDRGRMGLREREDNLTRFRDDESYPDMGERRQRDSRGRYM